jgi:uncharacterized protein
MLKFIAKIFIYFYKFIISPVLPKSCRFIPSCSEYSLDAIKKYGFFNGIILTIKRILSCHPFSRKNCLDEVPNSLSNISPFKYFGKFRKKS